MNEGYRRIKKPCTCGYTLGCSECVSWVPADGDRDGSTYDPALDRQPLNAQAQRVWNAMNDGEWHTLARLAAATGDPEASVSARMRDFRKDRFGGHTVSRIRVERVWWYRLHPNDGPEQPELFA